MTIKLKRACTAAIAISLSIGLGACSSITDGPENHTLYSVKQPVIERNTFTMDFASSASGLSIPEQQRLADWFETLDIGYGDRIAIDDAVNSPAVAEDVAALAARHGLLLSEGVPVTEGFIDPGNIRVVVTRSHAYVPGCPDWSDQFGTKLGNATSDGFGCAVNSNLAAMIADPEHLLEGASGSGETVVMTSNRAIETYRDREPSGAGGNLPEVSSTGN